MDIDLFPYWNLFVRLLSDQIRYALALVFFVTQALVLAVEVNRLKSGPAVFKLYIETCFFLHNSLTRNIVKVIRRVGMGRNYFAANFFYLDWGRVIGRMVQKFLLQPVLTRLIRSVRGTSFQMIVFGSDLC